MSQICPQCLASLSDNSLFCARCGTPVESTPISLTAWEALLYRNKTEAGRLVAVAYSSLNQQSPEDAILALESALALEGNLWQAHLLLGVLYNQQGRTVEAEHHLREALKTEPRALQYKPLLERWIAQQMASLSPEQPLQIWRQKPLLWASGVFLLCVFVGSLLAFKGLKSSPRTLKRAPQPEQKAPMFAPGTPPTYTPPYPPYLPGVPSPYPGNFFGFPSPASQGTGEETGEDTLEHRLPPARPKLPELIAKPLPGAQPLETLPTVGSMGGSRSAKPQPREGTKPLFPTSATNQTPPVISSPGKALPGAEPLPSPPEKPDTNPPAPSAKSPTDQEKQSTEAPPTTQEAELNGWELQRRAFEAFQAGRYNESADYYRQAIRAFRKQILRGQNVESARRALIACDAGLRLAESRRLAER